MTLIKKVMKKKRSHLFVLKKEKKNSWRNKKKLKDEIDKEENDDNIEVLSEKEIKYKTGRWSEEEHENFLKGLIEYGNDWKMVQKKVKTRTSSQSRSHAQKYFLKIKNIVSSKNLDEKGLYNFITNTYLNCIFDFQFTKLSLSDREKLYNSIVSNIDLFDKKKSQTQIPNEEENISVDYCNKYNIESKSNNNSFHSDEDDEISESKEEDNKIINNKRKRSINNKIFNVVKCAKYKNTEEYNKNKKNDININNTNNNTNNTNSNNNKKIKQKFTVNIINNNENSGINNNINNNTNHQIINNNCIINNNTINITANLNNNTTNNIDLSNCNIFNLNINTININFINNSSNKNLQSLGKPYQNTIENNNINESQKKILYDNFKFGEQSQNYFEDNQREEDDLSSINKKEKMFFITPL